MEKIKHNFINVVLVFIASMGVIFLFIFLAHKLFEMIINLIN